MRFHFRRTEFKELTAHFQFNDDYPASPLIIELKSKPLDFKMLQGLEKVCVEEVRKYLNKQQVRIYMLIFSITNPRLRLHTLGLCLAVMNTAMFDSSLGDTNAPVFTQVY